MKACHGQGVALALVLVLVVTVSGCGTRTPNRAPVEDRGTGIAPPMAAEAVVPPARASVSSDNAGKPGYYTVKPGDTLIRIGLDNGQSWRDIARWNNLENPNIIEVGQVLRVVAPTGAGVVAATVVARPVAAAAPITSTAVAPTAPASAAPPAATVAAPPAAASAAAAGAGDEDVTWAWPARGALISGFDEVRNKGVDIGGVAGEPVLAAADGRVVYVGASLRGYGNLIILKHNNTYLTAYAHNQLLLVKEDQSVRRGQKIAEMGNSDADRVKLHFEVRRQGKPVDPIKFLPPR
ncbi:MAG: peptidoglycan DD-metalloendopeptidase family protein [Rhodoferax sp.]|nr:peptidoglycan DD-metalloendopeptidase family protein [Rhodoferax sp.]